MSQNAEENCVQLHNTDAVQLLIAQCSDEDQVLSMTAATAASNIRGRFLERFRAEKPLEMHYLEQYEQE